jgi:aryl-alcohol dehydrogenase-like predicted oxidoreductase
MKLINFENIQTSNLGFGTSLLTRNNNLNEAILNLEIAYENGIRHFDCAKLYGFGNAENILGKFAKTKRNSITITSKSGLNSINLPFLLVPLINIFRTGYQSIHKIKGKVNSPAHIQLGTFDPIKLKKDIESSLKNLNTDYIDFYMLHEANVSSANRFDLISILELAKSKGLIRSYGIASNISNLNESFEKLYSNYRVIQHNVDLSNNLIFDPLSSYDNQRLTILYNIFSNYNKAISERYFLKSGYDNPSEYILSNLNKLNKDGITLFSSINNNNIKKNIEYWNSL